MNNDTTKTTKINGLEYVNLTGKKLYVQGTYFPPTPEGTIARLERKTLAYWDDGVPERSLKLVGIQNLPAPVPGTIYIVPWTVANALAACRNDLCYPDETEHPVGAKPEERYCRYLSYMTI